jgi:cytochrome c556
MKTNSVIASLGIVILCSTCAAILRAADQPPKYTVEEIMKAVFKGDDSIAKKVAQGKGTKEDLAKLAEYVESLPANDAPQGDPAGWIKKTTAVLDAVTALKEEKPDALAQFKLATDCKSCHSIYRPTD